MKYLFIILFSLLFSRHTIAAAVTNKRLILEPKIGINYSIWTQQIDSSPITGKLSGNNYGYHYGGSFHYLIRPYFSLGYGYNINKLTWLYADSDGFSADNSWKGSTNVTDYSHDINIAFRFTRFAMILQYIFISKLDMPEYFMSSISAAEFKGSGMGLKVQMPLGDYFYWGVSIRQITYDEVKFDNSKVTLPGTAVERKYDKKIVQSMLLDISLPFGIF